jgi:serine/threonine-protein kinase RsbW
VAESERVVVLEIAADHSEVRVARLVASGVASLAGFDVEAIEDLRIAIDEACVWLIDRADGGPLHLEFRRSGSGAIEVTGDASVSAAPPNEGFGDLVEQLLAATCVNHRFEVGTSRARFTFVTRSTSTVEAEPIQ